MPQYEAKMFELGRTYTRDEIHAVVGGSLQAFLPTVDGQVVCACLRTDMNPDAPDVVLVGDGEIIVSTAEQFASQAEPVPTFLKHATGEWVYRGMYRVRFASRDPGEIAERARRADRDDVVMLLYLERTEPR
jgi:hypothetical protein